MADDTREIVELTELPESDTKDAQNNTWSRQ